MTTIEYVTVSIVWQTLKLVKTSKVGTHMQCCTLFSFSNLAHLKLKTNSFALFILAFYMFVTEKKNRGITAILYMDGTPDEDVIVFNDLDEQTSPLQTLFS